MSPTDIKSLALSSHRLMTAHKRIIAALPDRKKRAAEAKTRNLFPTIISGIATLLNQHDIKDSRYPKESIAASLQEEEIMSLALSLYQIVIAHRRMVNNLSGRKKQTTKAKAKKLSSQIKRLISMLLDQHDIKVVEYKVGMEYTANYPMSVTNADEFDDAENLVVLQTLEPALIKNGKAIHSAKVVLSRAKNINKT